MATWSSKRKFGYALILIVIVVVAIGLPTWKLVYTPPSCVDGTQNGDETGIDCGGSCTKLCSNAFLPIPSPSWVRFRQAAPGIYNAAAYIVNPNPKAGALKIPYVLSLIDPQGITLAESRGVFDLPPGRNTLVFATSLVVKEQTPARAIIDIGKLPNWYIGSDPLPTVSVTDKNYVEATTSSSLNVSVKNSGALATGPLDVFAVLKDADQNVVDFSKTIVDGIGPNSTVIAPFTWPYGHSGKVISIEVLTVPE